MVVVALCCEDAGTGKRLEDRMDGTKYRAMIGKKTPVLDCKRLEYLRHCVPK